MKLDELEGWDTFRPEPNRPIGYISRKVPLECPEKDIKEVDVSIYASGDDAMMRAQINFPGFCEIWTITHEGQIFSDYIEDTGNETLYCMEAGVIETRTPIKTLGGLADFLIEYAREIDVLQFLKSYQEAMG